MIIFPPLLVIILTSVLETLILSANFSVILNLFPKWIGINTSGSTVFIKYSPAR